MKLIVIGISGITGGGKTTLATALHQYLNDRCNANAFDGISINQVILMHQDKYFWVRNSPNHTWIPEINFINREILSAMDMDKFAEDVSEMVKQLTHECATEPRSLSLSRTPVNILIIEGFLIYNDERINRFCELRFHVYLSSEVGYQRRLQRTFKHVNPKPRWYWDNYAWVYYQKHLNEVPNKSELILINGEHDVHCIFNETQDILKTFLQNQIKSNSVSI